LPALLLVQLLHVWSAASVKARPSGCVPVSASWMLPGSPNPGWTLKDNIFLCIQQQKDFSEVAQVEKNTRHGIRD